LRAALLKAPHEVEVVERELPPLAPDQVLVDVTECGVCASDVDLWAGKSPESLPDPVGHEAAGVVAEVGGEVESLAPGDHVVTWVPGGGMAEAMVARERHCVPVAPDVPYPAVAEPLACIVNAVELASPRLGDDVVIVGAGYMGNLLQLVSALRGPRSITVADLRPDALRRARELGATRVVDTGSESLADVVAELTDGAGADVVYEVTGVQPGLDLAAEVTRMEGKLCIVGYHQGAPRTIDLGRWNWMAFQVVNAHFRDPAVVMAGMRAGMRLVESGRLDASSLVTHRYPLERTAEAFETAAARPDGFVKAVVTP
jgi:2-desacetyl-2-hydroxyethyl bacteriochlorophyllide A dehydrogenase